ncbi:MAG: hypothetical protein C5B60_09115 [Chloroflexi bacterium]|nr:MAG: hypothetical protein C5B60_09115 [Chloroflexota bacterium]
MVDRANNKPQPVSRQAANRNQIINELRGLYAQALGSAPIVLDAQVEPEAAQTVQGQPPARDRS